MLDSDAQSALTDLRWHWDDAYKINVVEGAWSDQRGQTCRSGRCAVSAA